MTNVNPNATNAAATANPLQLTIHPLQQGSQSGSAQGASTASQTSFLSGQGGAPSFKDFLDTINPLQHIPVVSNVYQALTGDVPSSGAQIAGDTLFGGPLGLVGSIANSIVKNETGTDMAGNIIDAISGKQVPALVHAQEQGLTAGDPVNFHQLASYNPYVQPQSTTTSSTVATA